MFLQLIQDFRVFITTAIMSLLCSSHYQFDTYQFGTLPGMLSVQQVSQKRFAIPAILDGKLRDISSTILFERAIADSDGKALICTL